MRSEQRGACPQGQLAGARVRQGVPRSPQAKCAPPCSAAFLIHFRVCLELINSVRMGGKNYLTQKWGGAVKFNNNKNNGFVKS